MIAPLSYSQNPYTCSVTSYWFTEKVTKEKSLEKRSDERMSMVE